jgi:hypothetical protein
MTQKKGNIMAPAPGQITFTLKETERLDGGPLRTITFTNVEVVPLDYDTLAAAAAQTELTIPLEMLNGKILDTNVEDIDTSLYANIKATLTTSFTAKAIGLVRGGWLPSALAATRPETLVILDRNVVTEIVGRFDGGLGRGREKDFLDLFGQSPVHINPSLYAMEGNRRALPDRDHVRDQLGEAVRKIRSALPKARLTVTEQTIDAALGLIEEERETFGKRLAFLMRIAPMLAAPVGRGRAGSCWEKVIEAAISCGVDTQSIVVLSALSVVATRGGGPARGLLKFKPDYSEADAYNAACDIRALEYLLNCHGLFPNQPVQLCTADRALAMFWVALNASVERDAEGLTITITPHDQLLAEADVAKWNALHSS